MSNLPSITEYADAIRSPQAVYPSRLVGGFPIEKNGRLVRYAGGFCIVFPYQTPTQKFAVRCWHASVPECQERTQKVAQALSQSGLPYFVDFEYISNGILTSKGVQPIVLMEWVEASPLKQFIEVHLRDRELLLRLAENFKQMVGELHSKHIAHGDLQHGNILVKDDASIILVDYDSMYVPGLDGYADEIKGLEGYQHRVRWQNQILNEKLDYFSELVIYLSLRAIAIEPQLWYDLKIGETDTLVFSSDDFSSMGDSPIFQHLKHHPELEELLTRLQEALFATSINDLKPLEEAITSTADAISGKWASGNGYNPKKEQASERIRLVSNIADRFTKK